MGTMHPGGVCNNMGWPGWWNGWGCGNDVSDARLIANAGHLCKWIDSFHVLVVMRCGCKEINSEGC